MPTLIRVLALVVYAVVRMVGALFELLCMVPFLLLALGLGFVAMYLLATFFVSPAHAMTVAVVFLVVFVVVLFLYLWAEEHIKDVP
ncbi:hypothetical protein [uncultured Megasphaera sp.]|jgi:hypothetical protein|uniref:hypothetical protein n=1 Tax=uncultured Megasphaera sp. TaxID=165188 RepID=UPI0025953B2D|nr:hypothetical protein [uncultured Megasphaera sp.]